MMNSEVVMMKAALFQVHAVVEGIDDTFLQSQLRLAANVLGGAIDAATDDVNAARIGEIEFALNDLVMCANETSAADNARLATPLEMLLTDLQALKGATSLPADLVSAIRSLQQKLKIRRTAVERQTFLENPNEPLPHPPAELCGEAIVVRDQLAAA